MTWWPKECLQEEQDERGDEVTRGSRNVDV